MLYCLNPSCPHPENPNSNQHCQGCESELALSSQSYDFRQRYRIVKIFNVTTGERTYQAEDLHSRGKTCVIRKITSQGIGYQQTQELLQVEAEKIYNLNHPQIPQLFDYFTINNSLYLVQEFIRGENLLAEFTREGLFSETKILEILEQLLPVLQYIHNNGVSHGGIKPKNIIRTDNQKLKLINFNLGQQTTGIITETDRETDIYNLAETCIRLLNNSLPSDASWRRGISENLGKVLGKMLVPNNYLSAETVLTELNSQGIFQQIAVMSRKRFVRLIGLGSVGIASTFIVGNLNKLKLETFTYEVVTVNYGGQEIKRITKKAQYFTADLGNEVTMDLVSIPGGRFLMGSSTANQERDRDETPQHWVKIRPFFMGKYPVTQAQYAAVMGYNPSFFRGPDLPVEKVSWLEAVKFCEKLSQIINKVCRLPSESEWEYACKARTISPFHFGETLTVELANYRGHPTHVSPFSQTTEVGIFLPNNFGLYDMHGNVREWCSDVWNDSYFDAPKNGKPRESGENKEIKVIRSGSWFDYLDNCRSANRGSTINTNVSDMLGFRVVAV